MNDTQTTVDTLLAAKDKIIDGWCQGHYAEDADGNMVRPHNPSAVAFCLMGAVGAANPQPLPPGCRISWPLVAVQQAITASGFEQGPATFNDAPGRTKWEVVAMIDDAIRAEKDSE